MGLSIPVKAAQLQAIRGVRTECAVSYGYAYFSISTKDTIQLQRLLFKFHIGSGKDCNYKRLEYKDNSEEQFLIGTGLGEFGGLDWICAWLYGSQRWEIL